MAERPYTLASCAVSLDGYLAGAAGAPLRLSSAADFARVDQVRAGCDAILVGAATVRRDDPRLLVRSELHRRERLARGLPASPTRVTVTATGRLEPAAAFFTSGTDDRLVYVAGAAADAARQRLGALATVVDAGPSVSVRWLAEDLHRRGVHRLMVEGGSAVLTQFLTADLVDELHLVVAPVFVGCSDAPRFVGDGEFPWHPQRRAALAEVRRLEDTVLLVYGLSARFRTTASQEV